MFFERFWRTFHRIALKGAGPLFLLVGVFLVTFAYEPSAMAFLGQSVPQDVAAAGDMGLVALSLLGVVAGLFVLCPLLSLFYLRRDRHRRGAIVLFPPLALSFASVSAWLLR